MSGPSALLAVPIGLAEASAAPAVRATGSPDAARETAEDFESFFLWQVLESMFAGVPTDGPFGGGHAEQVYRSLLTQEFARAVGRAGGIGIADAVQREILKLQEVV
ncbi:MAG: rod-binding protein [Alphaproteobacteria bacterium]